MKWNLERRKLVDLKEWPKNPRLMTEKGIKDLTESITKFGLAEPLVINTDGVICGGHGRLKVLKGLGIAEVDCYAPAQALTEKQFEELNIRLNKNIAGEFDFERLANEWDIDELKAWGFEDADFETEPEEIIEDEAPPVAENPVSKYGDIWLLGNHKVMCGDSTKIGDVEKLMAGVKADMVFTDPPYGMSLDTDYSKIKVSKNSIGLKGNKIGNKYEPVIGDDADFDPSFLIAFFKDSKEQFWWGADYYIDKLPNFGKNGTLQVWNKRSSDAQQKGIGNCFELCWSKTKHKKYVFDFEWFGFLSKDDPKEARNRVHPTMKPTKLIERFFDKWGGGIKTVADVFMGSGATLIACEKTGRTCYGMELSEAYCDVIIKRWQNLTGKEAILENRNESFNNLFNNQKDAA